MQPILIALVMLVVLLTWLLLMVGLSLVAHEETFHSLVALAECEQHERR